MDLSNNLLSSNSTDNKCTNVFEPKTIDNG